MEKAYKNLDFLTSRDARSLRLLSEYLEPLSRFERYRVTDTVVFFGSARALPSDRAKELLTEAESSGDAATIERARNSVALSRYYDDAPIGCANDLTCTTSLRPSPRNSSVALICSIVAHVACARLPSRAARPEM